VAWEAEKALMLCKHCVINAVFFTNPKHNPIQATIQKINPISAKTSTPMHHNRLGISCCNSILAEKYLVVTMHLGLNMSQQCNLLLSTCILGHVGRLSGHPGRLSLDIRKTELLH